MKNILWKYKNIAHPATGEWVLIRLEWSFKNIDIVLVFVQAKYWP